MPRPNADHYELSNTKKRDLIKLIDIFGNNTVAPIPVNVG